MKYDERTDTRSSSSGSGWAGGAGTSTPTRPRGRKRPAGAAERTPAVPTLATERTFAEKWTPWALLAVRVGAGLLFMQHGAQKLFGLLGGFGPDGGTAQLFSQMGLAGGLEFFGGAAIVLGLLTRPIAALLAVEMLWAYVQAHMPQGGYPIQNGGELALLYALIFAVFAVRGAGRLSVDGKVWGRPAA